MPFIASFCGRKTQWFARVRWSIHSVSWTFWLRWTCPRIRTTAQGISSPPSLWWRPPARPRPTLRGGAPPQRVKRCERVVHGRLRVTAREPPSVRHAAEPEDGFCNVPDGKADAPGGGVG